MPDAPGTVSTPGGDGGGAPAPAAAPAPAPAAPAPAPTGTPAAPQPTAQETAQAAEDAEWGDAANEVFPGLKSTNKDKNNEQAKPKEGAEKTPADPKNPDGKIPNSQPGDGDDTPSEGGDTPAGDAEAKKPDTSARDNRLAQQEYAKRVETIKADVREKMYADIPKTLTDADGDPIESIGDVMKLINPKTGDLFTEVEAGTWLLNAQQEFNKGMAQIDKQIDQISELNADFKDQVDIVNYKYGVWLKANPNERDDLFTEWQETLTTDPKSGIITAMPYSLEKFYDRALKHRVETGEKPAPTAVAAPGTGDDDAAAIKAAAEAEAQAKADAETARKQKRADRSDVYAAPQPSTESEEDKEWGDAAKAYYGAALPNK